MSIAEDILRIIQVNPGIHFSEIKRRLQIGNGTAQYHLSKFEMGNLVLSIKCGNMRKFWIDGQISQGQYMQYSQPAQEILMVLMKHTNGLSIGEISKELNMSYSNINYHINSLVINNIIFKVKQGRKVICTFIGKPQL